MLDDSGWRLLPEHQVTQRLAALARGLQFVERCYTRIVRRADGSEAGDALQVSLCDALALLPLQSETCCIWESGVYHLVFMQNSFPS